MSRVGSKSNVPEASRDGSKVKVTEASREGSKAGVDASRAGSKGKVPEGSRDPSKLPLPGPEESREGSKAVEEAKRKSRDPSKAPVGPCRVLILQCQPLKEVADAIKLLDDAVCQAGGNIDFAVFPEGFLRKAVKRLPDPLDDPVLAELSAAARQHSLYLVAGTLDEHGDEAKYKRAFCFGRGGELLLSYRKIVPGQGDANTTKGQNSEFCFGTPYQRSTFNTEFGKVGTCIGSDAEDELVFRRLLQNGANLMLIPVGICTRSGKAFLDNPQMLKSSREVAFEGYRERLQAMAQEFNCTFARADLAAGKVENGSMPMGTSLLVGPSQAQQAETANATSFVVELTQHVPVPMKRTISKEAAGPR